MHKSRSLRRKRQRSDPATPRRGNKKTKKARAAANNTPVLARIESKIVWKDSPANKKLKASGTGKMAFRREVQGFVGRLDHESEHSSSSSGGVDKGRGRAGCSSRLKTSTWEEEKAVSRPLELRRPMRGDNDSSHESKASDSSGGRQRVTETRVLQDELFSTLEQKYASPEGARAVTGARVSSLDKQQPFCLYQRALTTPEVVADSTEELFMTATAGSSYSSTGAQSLETRKVDKMQEADRICVAGESLVASNLPNPIDGGSHVSSTQEAVKVSGEPTVVETDIFDDLTDESWALLDQLQSQKAPLKATPHSQLKFVAAQTVVPNARPVPPVSFHEVKGSQSMLSSNVSAIAVRPMHDTETANATRSLESYKRFLVLEIDRNVADRSLLLRLLDDQDVQLEALLSDDWYDVVVDAGDTINIVFTVQDDNGITSQNEYENRVNGQPLRIQVDNAHNFVVVHPDILVSPTRVTTSFGCLRRAVLQETLAVNHTTNEKAFLGTLKHDLFERALLHDLSSTEEFAKEARRIVQSNILGLVECGLNEKLATLEIQKVIGDYRTWMSEAIVGTGTLLNQAPSKNRLKARVSRVLATEEMMWSIKWGLKGATDASVEGTIVGQGPRNDVCAETKVLPLELKTGSKRYEHQGQVMLYTLLLNERYRQRSQDGLLIYVPAIETNRITAITAHVRGLIMARNGFASAIDKVKAIGSSTSGQVFPPMIRNRGDCERCFQVDECVLVHAAIENGTEESSGLDELFTFKTKHLGEADLSYFRQWNRLIMLEQQHAEKHLRALWLQVGLKRELARESSTCLAHLKLVSDKPSQPGSGTKRTLRFVRDRRKRRDVSSNSEGSIADWQPTSFAGVRFRADERVILSAESLDGKNLLVHVSRASVRKIEHGLITIETRQCIPSIVMSGQSAVGKEYTWRLDKDAIMSGLQRAKENLVQLFIGPPPEIISAGTALRNRPELHMRTTSITSVWDSGDDSVPGTGDVRRRNLIVHLTRPQFTACRVTDLVTQRCRDLSMDRTAAASGQALLDAFCKLNVDQQRAVERVVSSLDYALILGMPGTGKTATVAFTVRVLLFLGFSVLVTSYTHSAVDNLLLKLLACNVPMLRIGNTAQVHPHIAESTLDRQAEREEISSVQTMEAKLVNAQLVGCTCLSVNSHVLFKKRRFDFCIVDEATQITQPVILSALRSADTFVLVGDHYQLPPLVADAQARKEGMDVSLFRRLAEAHPEATQQLSFQYRMNRDIMLLANRLVYGGKLKCGSFEVASNHLDVRWQRQESGLHKLPWHIQILTEKQGVIFMNTDTMGSATTESAKTAQKMGTSGRQRVENVVEAQLIAGLVELLVLGSVPAEEIAVISPFRSQIALIQQHLTAIAAHRRAGGSDWVHSVEVSTIDKYQGKDKDVILVSFVRCNEENHVGELLTDWRRINVALTRAKQKLLLVGSESTLSGGSAFLHELLCVVQEQRWGYKLPADAIESLSRFAGNVAAPIEPDPEQGATCEWRARQRTKDVKVSILQRSAHSSNGDIESLVPDVSSLPLRPHSRTRLPHLMPLSRDIVGEM